MSLATPEYICAKLSLMHAAAESAAWRHGSTSAGRAIASEVRGEAVREMRDKHGVDFGLLFCEPGHAPLYKRLGWRFFEGEVFVEQPRQGCIRFRVTHPLVFDCKIGRMWEPSTCADYRGEPPTWQRNPRRTRYSRPVVFDYVSSVTRTWKLYTDASPTTRRCAFGTIRLTRSGSRPSAPCAGS
jgi:hypothetical protein